MLAQPMSLRRNLLGLILGVSVGCGPSVAERAQLSAQCASAGASAFERYKAELIERYGAPITPLLEKPKFHFSAKLETCLMQVGHWSLIPGTERRPGEKDSDFEDEVIDIY